MQFELAPLPYGEDALQPHISATTLKFHYGKHHQGYMNKLKQAIGGTAEAEKTLEQLIKTPPSQKVFNLAAQVWNHSFYWHSMTPDDGGQCSAALQAELDKQFGSLEGFYTAFSTAAKEQFGSGWTWLVKDGNKLAIVSTGNAENPLTDGLVPLLTLDVWEHAYYLDYQNKRDEYIDSFLKHLLNWKFVEQNFNAALP